MLSGTSRDEMGVTPETVLDRLGLDLPEPASPVGSFSMVSRAGSLLFVSGHGVFVDGRPVHTGTVGTDLDTRAGQEAARAVMLSLLATVKAEVGQLSRARCRKLIVFVTSAPGFAEQHVVANGATDLLASLYGPAVPPARSAVGVASLPFGFAVEIEAVFEVEDSWTAAPR